MRKINHTNEGFYSIDKIQEWFSKKRKFWSLISLVTLVSLITLQTFSVFLAGINSHIRYEIDFLLIPLLGLFVVSIFWRGSLQIFLSFAGAISIYAGMSFTYLKAAGLKNVPPLIANKLGYGKIVLSSPTESVASIYFFVGIIGLIMCILITFKPSLFRAKGTCFTLSHPVWKNEYDPKFEFGTDLIGLVPVLYLLSPTESHLVVKYEYILMIIGGKTYFVSPNDWVPRGSVTLRDKESGSILGIPKVKDGFGVW